MNGNRKDKRPAIEEMEEGDHSNMSEDLRLLPLEEEAEDATGKGVFRCGEATEAARSLASSGCGEAVETAGGLTSRIKEGFF